MKRYYRFSGSTLVEPGASVKWCFKPGKTAAQMVEMLKNGTGHIYPFGTKVLRKHGRFKNVQENFKGDKQSGRPKSANRDKLR